MPNDENDPIIVKVNYSGDFKASFVNVDGQKYVKCLAAQKGSMQEFGYLLLAKGGRVHKSLFFSKNEVIDLVAQLQKEDTYRDFLRSQN